MKVAGFCAIRLLSAETNPELESAKYIALAPMTVELVPKNVFALKFLLFLLISQNIQWLNSDSASGRIQAG